MVNASEDFADMFMRYLRKHESPDACASRPGVHRKVVAVEAAVKWQAQRLGTISWGCRLGVPNGHHAGTPQK